MVYFVRTQMLGRIVLPSTLALPFHIALVFLRVSASLLQGAYSHTEKHMRGQRMRQKIANRASSLFASSSRFRGRLIFCLHWWVGVSVRNRIWRRFSVFCLLSVNVCSWYKTHSNTGILAGVRNVFFLSVPGFQFGPVASSISLFSKLSTADQRVCLSFGFFFLFFFFKRISVALFKLWVLADYSDLGTPCPRNLFHHLGPSPMRPNELWTCPRDGTAMAQAHSCQRNSCGSVRRGRGGDRYNQRRG